MKPPAGIPAPAVAVPCPRSYLALGDSYTRGESVPRAESFPALLAARLEADGLPLTGTDVIAQTGWTTSDLLAAIAREKPVPAYSLVTLLIGVNNLYQGLPEASYRAEFTLLLKKAVELAGGRGRVIVMSIPDYGYTPFGRYGQASISKQTDRFNAINKAVTDSMGVSYADITPVSRSLEDGLVAPDGLHPSGKQYELWISRMYGMVKAKIR